MSGQQPGQIVLRRLAQRPTGFSHKIDGIGHRRNSVYDECQHHKQQADCKQAALQKQLDCLHPAPHFCHEEYSFFAHQPYGLARQLHWVYSVVIGFLNLWQFHPLLSIPEYLKLYSVCTELSNQACANQLSRCMSKGNTAIETDYFRQESGRSQALFL